MPSPIVSAPSVRLISTCGEPCSSSTCGEFGCSSDRSFRYIRWIWNKGAFGVSSAMRKSRGGRGAAPSAARRSPAIVPGRRLSRAGKQRLEPAGPIERHQLFAAGDGRLADEDLRHGSAPCEADHGIALAGPLVDPNLVDRLDAALAQQGLGAQAKGARRRAVHPDGLHRWSQAVFSTGRFAARHAVRPPASTCAFSKPSFFSTGTARDAREPVGQTTTTGSDLFFGRSREASRLARGTLLAPTGCAAAYSSGSLTSIRTAFSRLMSHTASVAETRAPPPTPVRIGQTSMAPETSAMAKRYQFWRTKFKVVVETPRSAR